LELNLGRFDLGRGNVIASISAARVLLDLCVMPMESFIMQGR
jgi:hypothetical protein